MPAGRGAPSAASLRIGRRTSSRECRWLSQQSPAPSRQPPFQRLQNTPLNGEHDGDKGKRVGDQSPDVKKLKEDLDRVAYAIRAAEQLDDQHDLPDQREPRAGSDQKKRRQLRQGDMPEGPPETQAKALRHIREIAVKGARALTQGHDNSRQLAERHRRDRGGFGKAQPDVEQYGDDE